jgi:hypothetical protein
MSAPSLSYAVDNIGDVIPEDLKALPQWITWRAGAVKEDGKFDKFPIGKNGSGNAWSQSPQWSTFDAALDHARTYQLAGVGLVLPAEMIDGTHLVALDFDTVDLDDGNPRLDEIKEIHKRIGSPYAEISPSGKGLRMFVKSTASIKQISCANKLGGKDELFCASIKWVTVTGRTYGGSGVPLATDAVGAIAGQWTAIAKPSKKPPERLTSQPATACVTPWLRMGQRRPASSR